MSAVETAAVVGAALIAVLVAFQIALAAGAPWGSAAWGGRNPGRLPSRLRVASAVSAVVLAIAAWVLLAEAGVVETSPLPATWLGVITWGMTGYFAVGAVMNLISRSKVERIWAPVSAIIAICCGLVAAA